MNATKQAARKRAATKRPAPARGAKAVAAAVRTMDALMAYAYALEIEAAERYSEFADAMEEHNNRAVGELFRKLDEWGERMRGTGETAEQIGRLFRVFARKFGLEGPLSPLETKHFRRPAPAIRQRTLFD